MPEELNIAIVCYPTYGGSGVVATEVGTNLAARGHSVHFVSYGYPVRLGDYRTGISYHEVPSYSYPLFPSQLYTLGLASKLVEVAQQNDIDIIHCHYAIPHAMSALLAKQMLERDVRVVTTLHGTDITLVGRDASFQSVTKHAIESSDGLSAVSHYLREETHEVFCTDCEIEVIYNFVDEDTFYPPWEAEQRDPEQAADRREMEAKFRERPEQKLLLHVSNFRPLKNAHHTVEILDKLVNEHGIDARLLLVGDGVEMPRVLDLSDELGLCGRIEQLGNQEFVSGLYRLSDLFLLPSESESFGLAALEAMACGTPVVGAEAGGMPEVVTEGEVGYLCEAGDIEAMAERSAELLTEADKHREFAENGVARSREVFDREDIVDRYEQLYRSVREGS